MYCRPVCKARLARRSNVEFFDTPSQAEAKGYRACKRCRPDVGGGMPEERAVGKVREFVALRHEGYDGGLGMEGHGKGEREGEREGDGGRSCRE